MILQTLVDYYEALAKRGEISKPGWSKVKVSYALSLGSDGKLNDVILLKTPIQVGKKTIFEQQSMTLPLPVKRTVGISSNFLCDNSTYFLGLDNKNPERAQKCFEACKELHLMLLSELSSSAAQAICGFFNKWEPAKALLDEVLIPHLDDIKSGANLVFVIDGSYVHEDHAICQAWQQHYENVSDNPQQQCLVTGKTSSIALLHPIIKGVRGAQSSGASLVSFNAKAYESYGRDEAQGLNAPVSEYAAFAYGTALNNLLSNLKHSLQIGDSTIVCWAEGGEPAYQNAFDAFFAGAGEKSIITDDDLRSILGKLADGKPVYWEGIALKPENMFYILGLSPNAARISVRFFLIGEFGTMIKNLKAHYDRLEIVRPQYDNWETLPVWKLLSETVNQNSKDKTPSPQLSGDTFKAILSGSKYPATLINSVMIRIKAEKKVTRGRAAIIKAYLLRNYEDKDLLEVSTVELNEDSNYLPYVLGRLFSVLEEIQEQSTEAKLNTTIKDSYFNSACSTPSNAFFHLLTLKESHMKKIKREKPGKAVLLEKQIEDLMGRIHTEFPARLMPNEQCTFILGYYHQNQKRYEKKNKEDSKNV